MQEVMRGVGSGGPEGPSRRPKVTSPPQELEVGAHRAPYLLVYYSSNKLKINADTNKLLLIYIKQKLHIYSKTNNAKGYKIKLSNAIQFLGVYLRSYLKLNTQINKLCANLHNHLYELRKLNKFTYFETRLLFVKYFVIGKLLYAMPIYMNCSVNNIKKTNTKLLWHLQGLP